MGDKNMPGNTELTLELLALADTAFLSKEDNKLNIIGIFDIFYVSKIPMAWPKMTLVGVLKGKANKDYRVNVKIHTAGKIILDQNLPIKLGDNGKSNLITNLNNFPLEFLGDYKIELFEGGQLLRDYSFRVIERKTEQDKAGNTPVN